MSENNIPTPEATPAPVTVATKAPKSKGLSMYNRIALVLLLVLIAATTTLFTLAVQKTKAERDIKAEIATVKEQVEALAAPAWCEQVTPDNVDKIDELYSKYDRMSPEAQEATKKECKERVDAVQLLKFQDAEHAFKVDSTCELDDAQTTLHCTADVSRQRHDKDQTRGLPDDRPDVPDLVRRYAACCRHPRPRHRKRHNRDDDEGREGVPRVHDALRPELGLPLQSRGHEVLPARVNQAP